MKTPDRYKVNKNSNIGVGKYDNGSEKQTVLEKIAYLAICFVISLLFSTVQTSFFAHFRPFGFAPDLCLSLCVAFSLRFNVKSSSALALMCGFFISSFAKSGFTLIIIFYLFISVCCSFINTEENKVNLPMFILFFITNFVCAAAKMVVSFVEMCVKLADVSITTGFLKVIFPEMLSTVFFSFIPYLFVALISHFTQKS